jgi:hypothetical protein
LKVATVTGRSLRPRLGVDFARLWTANAISNLGDGAARVAAPLLVASLTDSPALVAGAVLVQQLPWICSPCPPGPTSTGWSGGGYSWASTWPAAPSWRGWP